MSQVPGVRGLCSAFFSVPSCQKQVPCWLGCLPGMLTLLPVRSFNQRSQKTCFY